MRAPSPFWRAAYASDIDAMKLLVAHGADPGLSTTKIAGRPPTGDARREVKDVSGLPPVPVGGPAITPLQAAAGVGALELMKRLEQGTPGVFADPAATDQGRILFGPMSLKDGEPALIAERLRGLLGGGA